MPELPEVETIKNAVADALTGAVIEQTLVYQRKFRIPLDADFADQIQNCRIESFSRFAKYMMMHLSNHKTVIWHFGMSGKIKIESAIPATRDKHDHVIIKTDKVRMRILEGIHIAIFHCRKSIVFLQIRPHQIVVTAKDDHIKIEPVTDGIEVLCGQDILGFTGGRID